MKTAYFHAIGGASGDMILGAMVDVGLSLEALQAELAKLPLGGYRMAAGPAQRRGLRGTQVTVEVEGTQPALATLEGMLAVVRASPLPPPAKERGEAIFRRLAQAEARVHGITLERVRFHELAAVDTVVDVMGAVLGLELLGIGAIYSSPLPAGRGVIELEHGVYPLPAPATLELMAMAGAPLRTRTLEDGEQTTPTGAAILTTLGKFDSPLLHLERVGYGVGSREMCRLPNVLALWLGEMDGSPRERDLLLVETNIDNMNPELYGPAMERLLALGALDAWLTPIQMKKNRPAVILSVLCPPEAESPVVETLFRETSTLGLRLIPVRRVEVGREVVEFTSSLGPVRVKVKRFQGEALGLAPEFEDCRRLAEERGLPLPEVYRRVMAEASSRLHPAPGAGSPSGNPPQTKRRARR